MAAGKRPASYPEKQRIVDIHQDGNSTCDIVRIVGRSGSVEKRNVAKFNCSGSMNPPIDLVNQVKLHFGITVQNRLKS